MADSVFFRTSINGFNKTDVLQYIKELLDKNSEQAKELEALKIELQEQKRLVEEQARSTEDMFFDEDDIEKLSEQKLGRVMRDARRFSDLIVKEANDRADFIFENAVISSDEITEQVNALKNEAENFSSAFVSGMEEITEKLSALGNSLSAFKIGVEEEKKQFEEKICVEVEDDK